MSVNEKNGATRLGQFLRSVRESRGFSNINEYLRSFILPISDIYYREIESGKRQIALDRAKDLCQALKIDYPDFYYHLLKDILPPEVQGAFTSLMPLPLTLGESAQEMKRQKIKAAYQKNFMARLKQRVGYMNKETELYFYEHPQFAPFLTAIYCTEKTNENELVRMFGKDIDTMTLKQVLADFERLGLIKLSEDPICGTVIIERSHDFLIIRDLRLGALRLFRETKVSADTMVSNKSDLQPGEEVFNHGIVGLNEKEYQEIFTQLADLIVEFGAADGQGANLNTYLLALLITPEENYRLHEPKSEDNH